MKEQKYQCCYCGKYFARGTHVRKHEEVCGLSSEEKNRKKMNFILQKSARLKGKKTIYKEAFCKICNEKFTNRSSLLRHMKRKHGGCKNKIFEETANAFMKSTETTINTIPCSCCDRTFQCVRDLKKHKVHDHKGEKTFSCDICNKSYKSDKCLKSHKKIEHAERIFDCWICDKKFYYKQVLEKHIKTHTQPKQKAKKLFQNLRKTQKRTRLNKESEKIENQIKEYPELAQKVIWKNLIKTNPEIIDDMNKNPLTDKDIIEIIQETSIAVEKMMTILMKLRSKWGRHVITPNVRKALKERKELMASFFTLEYLDQNSEHCFKDKEGNVEPRWLVYCHDIQGLIDLKIVLLEENNLDPPSDMMEVAGLDGGKGKLLLCYSWSSMENRKMKGPKQCLVLALVAKVEETVHNIKVLFEKTKLNEQDIVLSGDLKVINIICGMQTHSAKHSCPYGECWKDTKTGRWVKGRDRTVENLNENQQAWVDKTGGGQTKKARDQLKNFKNVEHVPVLRPGRILELAPPPGLHTILIGGVNEILDGLDKARVPGLSWRLLPQLVGAPLYLVKEGYNGGGFEGERFTD